MVSEKKGKAARAGWGEGGQAGALDFPLTRP